MSAEKIIKQISADSQKEIRQIKKDAEKQVKTILDDAKKQAQTEAETILADGKKQSENVKKILISQASQDAKRNVMNAQEKVIQECFVKAHHSLSILPETKYKEIVTKLMQDGQKKLGPKCTVLVGRDYDKDIANKLGIPVSGTIEPCGGIILKSEDGRIILDHTFDGILRREKERMRIKVGKLLFSNDVKG